MFVRWKSRKRQKTQFSAGRAIDTRRRADGTTGQDVSWAAVLVEAVRVDGQPRQRHVAVVARITESQLAFTAEEVAAVNAEIAREFAGLEIPVARRAAGAALSHPTGNRRAMRKARPVTGGRTWV